jgi:predicted component of type VI protein secretion system
MHLSYVCIAIRARKAGRGLCVPQLIVVLEAPGVAARRYTFDQQEVRVGRAPNSDIVLEGAEVSRLHCKLVRREGRWRLSDCNSANGVHLDRGGRGIPFWARHDPVLDGDVFHIGPYRLAIGIESPAGRTGLPTPRVLDLAPHVPPLPQDPTDTTVLVQPTVVKDTMRQRLMEDAAALPIGSGTPKGPAQ